MTQSLPVLAAAPVSFDWAMLPMQTVIRPVRWNQLLTKSRKKPPVPKPPLPDANESRGAVAVTVVWMLLALSCLAAQLVALGTWLVARAAGIPANRPNALLLVPTTLMMVALVSGILLLMMTPLAYRVRKSRPPTAVTIAAVVIALAPLLTVAVVAVIG